MSKIYRTPAIVSLGNADQLTFGYPVLRPQKEILAGQSTSETLLDL